MLVAVLERASEGTGEPGHDGERDEQAVLGSSKQLAHRRGTCDSCPLREHACTQRIAAGRMRPAAAAAHGKALDGICSAITDALSQPSRLRGVGAFADAREEAAGIRHRVYLAGCSI